MNKVLDTLLSLSVALSLVGAYHLYEVKANTGNNIILTECSKGADTAQDYNECVGYEALVTYK